MADPVVLQMDALGSKCPHVACRRVALALSVLLASVAAHADWVVAGGASADLQGGAADLGCTDLIVDGTLTVGVGGSIQGVRNVRIGPGASLLLNGGHLSFAQQWDNRGSLNLGGGDAVRVDGGASCPAVGPLGSITRLSPEWVAVPAVQPGALLALAGLLAWLGGRRRRPASSISRRNRSDS